MCHLLGGEPILNLGKVSFPLDEETKSCKFSMFMDYVSNFFPYTEELMDFLHSVRSLDFYNNKLTVDYIYGTKVIKKGTKVIRSFKHFIQDTDLLETIQNKASELIQLDKLEGELCFSVHPLDFLSLSENQSRWRSCHALDGEYRAGNLSYMCDTSTLICYIKSENGDVKLPNFPESVPWNNKKWRCLFFLDNTQNTNVMFAGRPYPFSVDGVLNFIKEELDKRIHRSAWYDGKKMSNWEKPGHYYLDNNTELAHGYYQIGNHLYWKHNLIQDAKNSRHYNDLLYSSCYTPWYRHFDTRCMEPWIKINIGSEVKCLRCTEKPITTKDTMLCEDCELLYGHSDSDDYSYCACCGLRQLTNNMSWVGDDAVCESCYHNTSFTCACCGERYYNADSRYSKKLNGQVCFDCFNAEMEDEEEDG
jgi:hypothetical protein